LLIAATGLMLQACKVGEAPPPKTSVVIDAQFAGAWHIVNDSTIIQYWGIRAGKAQTGLNYAGKPADYYNFSPAGAVYIPEDNFLDTAAYVKMQADTMELQYPNAPVGYFDKFIVSNFTQHTLTLTGVSPAVSPETILTHIINLKR